MLAATGALCAILAAVDKIFGLMHRPLHLATLAYASLCLLLAWACFRGIPVRPARLLRVSLYAGFLLLNLLTAAYVFAWKVSADPTPVVLQSELTHGDALLAAGDTDGAYALYRTANHRFPASFPVLMRLGAAEYRIGDYDRARRHFSRAVDVAPRGSRWKALNDLGQTFWKLKQPAQAVELYEQAGREGVPPAERAEWHYRLGWAYFDLNDYDAAIRHYRAVVDAGRKYVAASYYNIACALAEKEKGAHDPAERHQLTVEAVGSLRDAWDAIQTPEERLSLRTGLLGKAGSRDPELEPLRSSPAFQEFLHSLPAS